MLPRSNLKEVTIDKFIKIVKNRRKTIIKQVTMNLWNKILRDSTAVIG